MIQGSDPDFYRDSEPYVFPNSENGESKSFGFFPNWRIFLTAFRVNGSRADLASRLGWAHGTVCRLMRDQLLPLGLIEAKKIHFGGRGRYLRLYGLTPKGRYILEHLDMAERTWPVIPQRDLSELPNIVLEPTQRKHWKTKHHRITTMIGVPE